MGLLPADWRPRLIVCDIDGTITDRGQRLHAPIIDAFQRCEAAGIPVAFATGNVRPTVWTLARHLKLTGPLICENGGLIWDWKGSSEVVHLADGKRAQAAAKWLATRIKGLDPVGITSNAWRETEWCLFAHEDVDAIRRELADSEWADLAVVKTGFAIHLHEPGMDKGTGLATALKMLGINAADVLAIGDAPNDLPLFEAAGWSIAVGGAFPEVTEAASASATEMHGAAVVAAIDEILN